MEWASEVSVRIVLEDGTLVTATTKTVSGCIGMDAALGLRVVKAKPHALVLLH